MRWCFVFLAFASLLRAETGSFTIHLLLHAIGQENYSLSKAGSKTVINTTIEYSDRGTKRSATAELQMDSNYLPQNFESKEKPTWVNISGGKASIQEDLASRTFDLPGQYFTIFGPSPFAVQLALMRYWGRHGKPAAVPTLRATPGAAPIRIELAGHETITVDHKKILLDRYTVANLMFGQEACLDGSQQ